MSAFPDFYGLRQAARTCTPTEGLGCLVAGTHNALSAHAQPALDAVDDWIAGNALDARAEELIGLGPGLTPAGDDYLGGVMVALHLLDRAGQAAALWRWLEPRLAQRSNAISAGALRRRRRGRSARALHELPFSSLFQREAGLGPVLDRPRCASVTAPAGTPSPER
mgnify:CR=1 FL=1